MLNAINTKILIAILAALTVIGGAVHLSTRPGGKDSRSRRQGSRNSSATAERRLRSKQERDEAFRKQVEADKKRHNSAAAHEGKTWKTYIP